MEAELEAQFALEKRILDLEHEIKHKSQVLELERTHLEALTRRHTEGLSISEYDLLDEQIKYLENSLYQLDKLFEVGMKVLEMQQQHKIKGHFLENELREKQSALRSERFQKQIEMLRQDRANDYGN